MTENGYRDTSEPLSRSTLVSFGAAIYDDLTSHMDMGSRDDIGVWFKLPYSLKPT